MEHARGQQPGGPGLRTLHEMRQPADPARGHHGQPHRAADRAQQVEVEARAGAVAIHAGQQDLARAEPGHAAAPLDRVDAGAAPSAMGEHLPPPRSRGAGIDRDDDALAAEFFRGLAEPAPAGRRRRS